jgi:hypothetical protein
MLAAVDEAVAQIVASLQKTGMLENTLIIFSSDNGGPPPGKNTPLRDFKATIYEGGTRAAAFAHWPGRIPAGKTIEGAMHIIDWYPTLVGLAGGSLKQALPIDGKDVWPMITKAGKSPHKAILSVSTRGPSQAAIRMGDWKLIVADAEESDSASQKNNLRNTNRCLFLILQKTRVNPGTWLPPIPIRLLHFAKNCLYCSRTQLRLAGNKTYNHFPKIERTGLPIHTCGAFSLRAAAMVAAVSKVMMLS